MAEFTHIDDKGFVRIVDVTQKPETQRTATACGEISMCNDAFQAVINSTGTKGNVLETARIAGVMAAKKTSDIIPMCHPLNLTHVSVDFTPVSESDKSTISISATAKLAGKTGVEMEALVAVSAAALTIYDMVKSFDKSMEISNIRLMQKSGGKSGDYKAE